MGKKIVMPKLKKISSRTYEAIRKETSEYIYVADKEGNARCECCGSEFILPKTKHLKETKCPVCKRNMITLHKFRRKNEEWRTHWRVVASAVNNSTLVLRYIFVSRNDDKIIHIEERARKVINFETKEIRYWELPLGKTEWKRQDKEFFKEFYIYVFREHMCCLPAEIHNMNCFLKELKKLDVFKYVELKSIFNIKTRYVSTLVNGTAEKSLIFEQLQKAGYSDLVISDLTETRYGISSFTYNQEEKSLSKKLGLTDRTFKMLKKYQTIENYNVLRNYPQILESDFEAFQKWEWSKSDIDEFYTHNLKIKQGRYIFNNELVIREYIHYIHLCEELKYPKTDYYLYPKDFRNMDMIVSNEYQAQRDKIAYEKRQKNSEQIHLISEKIRELNGIQQLMQGLNGLIVYVPDSADDLTREGKEQCNCVGTYVERIAQQKTLVFFIREQNNPQKSFITMEVSYEGKVYQVMYKGNKRCDDTNILNFADKVATVVRTNSNRLMLAA